MQRIVIFFLTIYTYSWFHGDISTPESEARLLGKAEGTFLVRFSTSSPGCYTISKVSGQTIKHQKVQHKAGSGFEVNGVVYKSLLELIKAQASNLNLQAPCLGSKFITYFVEQKISGYVN
jgi:hypothetical protein